MKTPIHLPIAMLVSALLSLSGLMAQNTASHENRSSGGPIIGQPPGPVLFTDMVDERFRPVAYHANALRRTVYRGGEGLYHLRVVGASGTLRLAGTYLDAELRQPHGEFTYYHPSGQMESRGRYERGIKAGVWERGSWDGRRLAERVYTGLDWEELQFHVGLATRAETLASAEY